ncbi:MULTISPECIES: hypothetical protein [Psychrilyobacter]|uniref:Uncharacterized protein n=1 Tax=Psychrilyobacter piezotolerans TaxID=2293438 RepID=A0ABX9KM00_9FUSO|nr:MULTISPECIES: hypothetical protein [Psychrilyobacter]MCS5422044.1 hypothetical protein [Psychrilyobacter sp. S5]NDI76362.1 hypothetical protein [Psychrilyobacter piezotolerans]RDE65960.1 hypothetical protein DV867_00355 [Psychrilyobacter sp. S5]REI43138.1 hypothetical protein DYH56_00355 [Psychrilyobacter piezotolerans]
MKVSSRKNKWVFEFDTISIVCGITKVNNIYTVLFELNDKIIKINTSDLDKTFLSLEESFNSNTISNYR